MFSNSLRRLVGATAILALLTVLNAPTVLASQEPRTILTRTADVGRPRTVNAASQTSARRKLFVTTSTEAVPPEIIERKLAQRAEFHALGLDLTRDADAADLVVEVQRIVLSRTDTLS